MQTNQLHPSTLEEESEEEQDARELAEMKKIVVQMMAEADKLREVVCRASPKPSKVIEKESEQPGLVASLTGHEKEMADSRSIYVGNVCFSLIHPRLVFLL